MINLFFLPPREATLLLSVKPANYVILRHPTSKIMVH